MLPGLLGRDSPCKYHGQIPHWERKRARFAIRLDDPVADLSLDALFAYYLVAKEFGVLPDSNIEDCDYWTHWSN